jgi:hypothetical protein
MTYLSSYRLLYAHAPPNNQSTVVQVAILGNSLISEVSLPHRAAAAGLHQTVTIRPLLDFLPRIYLHLPPPAKSLGKVPTPWKRRTTSRTRASEATAFSVCNLR